MYRHILLATDLEPDTSLLAERVADIVAAGTQLTLIHVIEPLALAYGAEMPVDLAALQEEVSRQARKKLDELAKYLAIGSESCLLVTGTIEKEILRVAQEQGVDLIVLGSHSRRGLAALLGSTANAVLHHAHCDVLAVRIARH
ncbi:MAG: universal stress protein [Pseudomonadota bacterium]